MIRLFVKQLFYNKNSVVKLSSSEFQWMTFGNWLFTAKTVFVVLALSTDILRKVLFLLFSSQLLRFFSFYHFPPNFYVFFPFSIFLPTFTLFFPIRNVLDVFEKITELLERTRVLTINFYLYRLHRKWIPALYRISYGEKYEHQIAVRCVFEIVR